LLYIREWQIPRPCGWRALAFATHETRGEKKREGGLGLDISRIISLPALQEVAQNRLTTP
jgi:hypothetical protein